MKPLRAIVIDDSQRFRVALSDFLKRDFPFQSVEHTNDREEAVSFSPGADFIFLDCVDVLVGSYWNDLLPSMRAKHSSAYIVLLTQYKDPEVMKHLQDPKANHVLTRDPLLDFVDKEAKRPKPPAPRTEGEREKLSDYCKTRLRAVLEKLVDQIGRRRQLEGTLVECALAAAGEILASEIHVLVREEPVSAEKKGRTYRMDVIAEEAIADVFGPFVHSHDILVCTEERGEHNELHHRIMSPRFYIFSDPFDGSTRAREFLRGLCGEGLAGRTLWDIVRDPGCMKDWEKDHGSKALNSPMVSVVLAERHRVVAAVLVNLFTRDVFLAVEGGIFWHSDVDFARISLNVLKQRLRAGECLEDVDGWEKLEFRRLRQPLERNLAEGNVGLFLCTLQAGKVVNAEPSTYYSHASVCISPLLPVEFRWQDSFDLRARQSDFTPGPGRILFLLGSNPTDEYDEKSLGGQRYECVLSAGEPLTEWIGWFAFLRHSTGISAYCLRRKGSPLSGCPHRNKSTDEATLLPDAILSIFRKGRMDLSLLLVAYGRGMRSYHDTILIVYDDDPDWSRVFERVEEDDRFVRIPTF